MSVQYRSVPLLSNAPFFAVVKVDPAGINIGLSSVVPAAKVNPVPTWRFVMRVLPEPTTKALAPEYTIFPLDGVRFAPVQPREVGKMPA